MGAGQKGITQSPPLQPAQTLPVLFLQLGKQCALSGAAGGLGSAEKGHYGFL